MTLFFRSSSCNFFLAWQQSSCSISPRPPACGTAKTFLKKPRDWFNAALCIDHNSRHHKLSYEGSGVERDEVQKALDTDVHVAPFLIVWDQRTDGGERAQVGRTMPFLRGHGGGQYVLQAVGHHWCVWWWVGEIGGLWKILIIRGLPYMTSAKFSYVLTPPCHCHKSADFAPFVCFLGTPLPHPLRTSFMEAPLVLSYLEFIQLILTVVNSRSLPE